MALEFPFVKLNDVEKAFSQIPNYRQVLEKCPEDGVGRDWEEAVLILHLRDGWTKERQEDALRLFKTKDFEEMSIQLAYLAAWLGNFKPSHEEKIRVGGWLLSLMFRECPHWQSRK